MEDYSRKVGIASLLLILLLIAIGYIPARTIGDVELKRINILSDLTPLSTSASDDVSIPVALKLDEKDYEIDLLQVSATVAHTRELLAIHNEPIESSAVIAKDSSDYEERNVVDSSRLLPNIELTPIENFDTTANNPFRRLFTKLNTPHSRVRIALLGDSFVEGDILSCDLREILQSRYGGYGAGFVPMDSPLTRYRRTIKTTSSGWSTYNIMQKRTTPSDLAPNYYVSGWISRPENGASTRWEGSVSRKYLTNWDSSSLLFMSQERSRIDVIINDSITTSHIFEGKKIVQQLKITEENIRSIEFRVTSGADSFIGYGAIHESDKEGGITLDNYSVRSNNGQATLWTNPAVNAQIDYLIDGYDLVILQYGLNIMQKGVNNYTRYSQQIEKIILFCRECFPHAAILVMGVSERSLKENGTYKSMSEAQNLTLYQRQAAQNTHTAFWNTYDAMQAQGGISSFVRYKWAAKDFTHINLAGGRQLARALADALIYVHVTTTPAVIRNNYDNVIPEDNTVMPLNNL